MTLNFAGAALSKGFVAFGGERHDIYNGSAAVFYGGKGSRTTAPRVVVGGVLAGPAGAAVGALARKGHTNVYVSVTLSDGYSFEIGPGRNERDARAFAREVNEAAAGRGPEKDPR